eukprot:Phypoly_transcript_19859.p1 GENE.Phypoly_transcript_19859~~Phypoly_transcript_19859.p1  ORF type:complete len:205 (+),score=19.55 Phypoly_transcript_19859:51-665(+)
MQHGSPQEHPVFLFDVMDTLIVDPFWKEVPKFFGLCMDELMKQKHPTTWVEFELGKISEQELFERFLHTRKIPLDEGNEFKRMLHDSYQFVTGMDTLLQELNMKGYEVHALSNYSEWYQIIEKRHRLSQYGFKWSFVSCNSGIRKPNPQSYLNACAELNKQPSECVFIDDNISNVEAAQKLGLNSVHFTGAETLREYFTKQGYL